MNDLVIRIKGDSPEQRQVIEVLRGELTPQGAKQLAGWRAGRRAASDRAVALIQHALSDLESGSEVKDVKPLPARGNYNLESLDAW